MTEEPTGIADRIAAVLARHWFVYRRIGFTRIATNVPGYCSCGWRPSDDLVLDEHSRHVADVLVTELPSWDWLMDCLDRTYPEDIFPTLEDREDRDTGPRIVSLLRQINALRSADE